MQQTAEATDGREKSKREFHPVMLPDLVEKTRVVWVKLGDLQDWQLPCLCPLIATARCCCPQVNWRKSAWNVLQRYFYPLS
jgi:hypothetical protein